MVGPEQALTPEKGAARRAVLRAVAIGWGLAEKSVSIRMDRILNPDEETTSWRERCRRQLHQTLDWLEDHASGKDWYLDDAMTQADITIACGLEHVKRRRSGAGGWTSYPKLIKVLRKAEALDAFKAVPFDQDEQPA